MKKRRWSKKSIGNKAAEEEKICSVEKVGEKGKESASEKLKESRSLNKPSRKARRSVQQREKENQSGEEAAAGVAGFQLSIGSGTHEKPVSHLFLCEVQSIPCLQKRNAQIILN